MSANLKQSGFLRVRAASPAMRRYAFVAFTMLVVVMGGASRSDVASLIFLRPLAFAFAAYALLVRGPASHPVQRPLALLSLAALAVAWQLVPLPPNFWHQLPDREIIADIDRLLGLESIWRPVAMSPAGAWNALFSLAVPLAGLLLYANLESSDRKLLPVLWLAIAVTSAMLGLAQLLGPPEGPLYHYANSTDGMPSGLFANNNHQAVFLGAAIPLAFLWAGMSQRPGGVRLLIAAAGSALFLWVVILTQSRAGIGVAVVGTALGIAMLVQQHSATGFPAGARNGKAQRTVSKLQASAIRHMTLLVTALVAVAAVGVLIIVRSSTIVQFEPSEEMRIRALPTIFEMLQSHWLIGAGGGSFDDAYRISEPTDLLSPYYLNQAHNDWLQVPIEYGLPGLAVLLWAMILFARAGLAVLRDSSLAITARLAIVSPPLAFAAASLVDYPVRVPLVQLVLICWLVAMRDHHKMFGATAATRRTSARSSVYHPAAIR